MVDTLVPTSVSTSSLQSLTWTWRDYKICYTVEGSGKPLVLVHGFGASIGHWRKNMPVLAAGGYRVYALDLLGFGASDKPAIDYTVDLWQILLRDFWQMHIQEPTVFVGNSIGALLCLKLIAEEPDLAVGGILLNCAGGLNHQSEDLNPIFKAIMGTFTAVVNSDPLGPFLFNQIRRKSQIRRTLYQVYGDREAVTDELVDLLHEPSCDPNAQKVFAAVLRAPAGPKPKDLLPTVQRPLQVLWGEADPWAPIETGRKMFANMNPDYALDFVPIPKTGHCPHDERPEMVNPLILDWLKTHHR